MTYSVPDICDEFLEEISVLEPLFSSFGGKQRFSGEIITVIASSDLGLKF
jgi:regulator of ribonuclease activity A